MSNPTYDRRKEEGVCVLCGQSPARPNKTMCAQCAAHVGKETLIDANEARNAGICIYCKKQPATDTVFCDECREKNASNCKTRYYQHKEQGLCVSCGKNKPEPRRINCSDCLREGRIKTQRSYYKRFPERLNALERDSYRCRLCGTERGQMHIHHIDGNGVHSDNPNDEIDNLVTLCSSCHSAIHGARKRFRNRDLAAYLISV